MVDQTLEGLTRRLASELDKNAGDDTATFYLKVRALEDLSTFTGEVGTIYRKDDQGERPVIDIHKLDYSDTLIDQYEKKNLLNKTLLLLLALPGSLWRILRAMLAGKPSKTRAEKIQLLFAIGVLCLLVVYVAILFGALWATVAAVIPGSARIAWFTPSFWLSVSPLLVVLSAVIGLFLPPKFNLKDIISKAAVDYICVIYYLNLGERRNALVGRLEALIDEISRKSEKERNKGSGCNYRHIHLLTYSFGSIVALDALFPAGRTPGRPLRAIHTLVTIGCPFDFVRTFWSDYFDSRREYEKNHPVRWLNVYSPLDVLASNFRNDPDTSDANINIRSETTSPGTDVPLPINIHFREGLDFAQLSWSSSLKLIGLRSHSMYWSNNTEAEVNCFSQLVPKMYDGDEILG